MLGIHRQLQRRLVDRRFVGIGDLAGIDIAAASASTPAAVRSFMPTWIPIAKRLIIQRVIGRGAGNRLGLFDRGQRRGYVLGIARLLGVGKRLCHALGELGSFGASAAIALAPNRRLADTAANRNLRVMESRPFVMRPVGRK